MDIISYVLAKGKLTQAVSDYLGEHLTNPTNPPIDDSLTIEGAAADAKATGTAISALNADLTQVETDLANVETDVDLLKNIHSGSLTYAQIRAIVQAGRASEWFSVGDQIEVTWNDGTTDYDCPFDIVAIRDVYTEDSEDAVPGMILQMHYALKDAIQFDQNEAFYVLSERLSAGTYYFTFGTSWGSKDVVSGDGYYFTTTQDYEAGAQFVIGTASNDASSLPDTYATTWRVRTYASSTDTTPTEILELTEGTEGTSLGTITNSIKYADSGINNLQRCGYGYNRWSQSAFRQYLNSSADAGAWWAPQNPFDRAPTQLSSLPGFMAGFDSDFLAILSPVKVTTALNTVSDSEIGTSEDTYDTFFLASLEEEYIMPQLSGVEGDYWPYWKDRLELTSPQAQYAAGTNANHIRYKLGATTTAQYCRLRSAYRGYAHGTWLVYATGAVASSSASGSLAGAAACVIC